MQAALVDLEDVRGNAADGIHGASAGGVWQAVVLGFGGFQLTQKAQWRIHICPNWTRLKYKIHWRGDGMSSICALVPTSGASSLTWMVSDGYGRITLSSLAKMADEEGLPFDQQANDAIRVCRVDADGR